MGNPNTNSATNSPNPVVIAARTAGNVTVGTGKFIGRQAANLSLLSTELFANLAKTASLVSFLGLGGSTLLLALFKGAIDNTLKNNQEESINTTDILMTFAVLTALAGGTTICAYKVEKFAKNRLYSNK